MHAQNSAYISDCLYCRFEKVGAILDLPFLPSFCDLSDENFHHTFSGTVRTKKLKLGTDLNSGWMLLNHPFMSSFFFLSSFQTENFVAFSQELWGLQSWNLNSGWICREHRNQAAAAYLSLYFFIFLSNFQALKIFIIFFSGTVRTTKLKLGTHVDNGCIYHVYRN